MLPHTHYRTEHCLPQHLLGIDLQAKHLCPCKCLFSQVGGLGHIFLDGVLHFFPDAWHPQEISRLHLLKSVHQGALCGMEQMSTAVLSRATHVSHVSITCPSRVLTYPSHVHHVSFMCPSCLSHITCPSHVHHMPFMCPSHVPHVSITCPSHVHYMYLMCSSPFSLSVAFATGLGNNPLASKQPVRLRFTHSTPYMHVCVCACVCKCACIDVCACVHMCVSVQKHKS